MLTKLIAQNGLLKKQLTGLRQECRAARVGATVSLVIAVIEFIAILFLTRG